MIDADPRRQKRNWCDARFGRTEPKVDILNLGNHPQIVDPFVESVQFDLHTEKVRAPLWRFVARLQRIRLNVSWDEELPK